MQCQPELLTALVINLPCVVEAESCLEGIDERDTMTVALPLVVLVQLGNNHVGRERCKVMSVR